MLTCSIVYATPHTNARRLSESMLAVVGSRCIYCGKMDDRALDADVIFWGGNTDTKTSKIREFEKKLEGRVVVPYGHLCVGGAKDLYAIGDYAGKIMENAERIARQTGKRPDHHHREAV